MTEVPDYIKSVCEFRSGEQVHTISVANYAMSAFQGVKEA
jgi:hypothetical protein